MKKILTSLLLLACCATVGQAQMPVTVQRQLPTVIEQFNQEKPFLNHAYWYVLTDVDSDGFNEFAITDFEKQFTSTFKITNEKLERIRTIPSGNVDWKPIFYIYSTEGRNANLDVTLKHRPLFLNKIQIAKNRFSTNNGTWMTEGVDVGKMKRAAMVKKMFRGYSDYQATPFIVPKAWLNDHNVLNYTRWLNGEKENPVSRDALGIISRFYGGRKVIASKWLASCSINERHFYMVLFEPQNGKGLLSMVCLAEGEVVSAYNEWFELSKDNKLTDDGRDYSKELFFYAPQIMAMVATSPGLELYVRWNSLEGMHYSIWREFDTQWIQIQDDYEYLQAW